MITVASPKKSPSLNQNGHAFLTDENGVQFPVIAVFSPDVNGNSGLDTQDLEPGQTSQVTGLQDAPQNIPHGLGVVPSLVLAAPYDNTASGSTPFTFQIAEGAHDSTNLKITATSGLKYKVIAFA